MFADIIESFEHPRVTKRLISISKNKNLNYEEKIDALILYRISPIKDAFIDRLKKQLKPISRLSNVESDYMWIFNGDIWITADYKWAKIWVVYNMDSQQITFTNYRNLTDPHFQSDLRAPIPPDIRMAVLMIRNECENISYLGGMYGHCCALCDDLMKNILPGGGVSDDEWDELYEILTSELSYNYGDDDDKENRVKIVESDEDYWTDEEPIDDLEEVD